MIIAKEISFQYESKSVPGIKELPFFHNTFLAALHQRFFNMTDVDNFRVVEIHRHISDSKDVLRRLSSCIFSAG